MLSRQNILGYVLAASSTIALLIFSSFAMSFVAWIGSKVPDYQWLFLFGTMALMAIGGAASLRCWEKVAPTTKVSPEPDASESIDAVVRHIVTSQEFEALVQRAANRAAAAAVEMTRNETVP